MTRIKRREWDKKIWHLLWPILLMNLTQRFGNLFEGVLVSVNSTDELTITSLCSPYIMLIGNVSYGLGIAVNAMTGQLDRDGMWQKCWRRATSTMLLILVSFGAIMSIMTLLLMYPALSEVPELKMTAMGYMLPYLLGSPITLLFQVLISAMRGLKNSKAGMWMIFVSVPVQLLVGWSCYNTFGLAGLGLGSLASNIVGCIIGISCYKQHLNKESGNERLPKEFAKQFLGLAVPVSLSKMVGPVANTTITALVLSIGSVYVGANGLAGRMEAFFYMPAMAMGSVAITLVAQEKSEESIWPLCQRLCLWSITPTIIMTIIAKLSDDVIWGYISDDAMLIAAGVEHWSICLWAYVLIALEMTFTGILQARGCGMPLLVVTVIRLWCVQLPVTFLATKFGWGAKGAWFAFLLANVCSFLTSFIWAWIKIKGEKKHECN